ncbi:MAG TPA: 2,3-diphosphoglycerate-dependent phosphoglycerate mutase [Chthonomonadales bacterium]|nr:2,3-diphosphoglycerate-dependent phosphoglycerate mutase [Chthonomonadales bacterium]
MAKLVLLRHGQSTWNLANRFTGWVDVPLTEKGEREARAAGERLRGIPFDLVFTSVLKRAIDTTILALEEAGQAHLPMSYDKALNERMYGELQGLDKAETARQYGDHQVKIWRRSYDVRPPGGESLKDTAARTLPYFESHIMPAVRAGRNVLVSAHGNSLRAIVMSLDRLGEAEVLELNIPNGVPIVYEIDDAGRVTGKEELAIAV